ncbi:uncharacterized protein METZ01_LOCUS175410 [marine metagenome]|jgi:purine-nucleoside phosphorylase|uniref:Nucleoside phosphorylase domain-containing protein n=1 Tax=marine metagenome TaxID=408172 RepID=A0A382C917_9ZZZZ
MSMVPDVLVARQMGMRVVGLSIISDECFRNTPGPVDVGDVTAVVQEAEPKLTRLMIAIVAQL